MANRTGNTSLSGKLRDALVAGFNRTYTEAKVDPAKYLERIRRAHFLPIDSFHDMFAMPQEVVDKLADQTISAAIKIAVLEGAGLGMGGFLTVIPDMAILSAIVMRMLQKLSLLYGFEYATDDEIATLWIAAASAAGLELGRDFVEKQAVEKLVPRIIERIAVRMSAEVAETWASRLIPILSGAIGGGLNYYFVRGWARRAKRHFREKHMAIRAQMAYSNSLNPRGVMALPHTIDPNI
jgi:uncharacterized protein (DUF697 family)